jgi:hypothetical protein
MQAKVNNKITTIKTKQHVFSLLQRHFTEHIVGVEMKPPRKWHEKLKKLKPLIQWLKYNTRT